MTITIYDDAIDSRDVISAIADLEPWKIYRSSDDSDIASFKTEAEALQFIIDEDYDPAKVEVDADVDEFTLLRELVALQDEAEPLAPDWENGQSLIRDSYFAQYAEEYANDLGLTPDEGSWPLMFIDWEAAAGALKQDFSLVSFGGVSYWIGN